MNISERVASPRVGEKPQDHKRRQERFAKACKEILNTPEGRIILGELVQSTHPMQPRFHESLSTSQSAFLDGEISTLSFLIHTSNNTDLLQLPPALIDKT
jgi:hypothetical protein